MNALKALNNPTIKELVEVYNDAAKKLDEPLVIRFSSKAAGLKRVEKILKRVEELAPAKEEKETHKDISAHEARSAGVARSWKDPEVRAKRSQRNGVIVNGEEFRSVPAAFAHFDLPMKEMIPFRLYLKEHGKAVNYDMEWELV